MRTNIIAVPRYGFVTLALMLSGPAAWAQSAVDASSSLEAQLESPNSPGKSVGWLDSASIGAGDGATLVPLSKVSNPVSFDDRFLSYADTKNNASIITKAAPWAAPVQMPAVDGINGSIAAFGGGATGSSGLYGTEGSLSLPIGRQFGAQIDAGAGSLNNSALYNSALHLFWRDPSVGLAGVYSSYSHWNGTAGFNASIEHNAAEGEYYAGRWTFGGIAGVETVQTRAPAGVTSFYFPTRGFDAVSASYYATDNWKFSIGHIYSLGTNALTLGTEYGFGLGGGKMATLFADGIIGEGGTYTALAGVRFYFGEHEKTLIERNRQDDPSSGHNLNFMDALEEGKLLGKIRYFYTGDTSDTANACGPGLTLYYDPDVPGGFYCSK